MRSPPAPPVPLPFPIALAAAAGLVLALLLGAGGCGSDSGGGGGGGGEPDSGATLFVPAAEIRLATGANQVLVRSLLPTADDRILLVDGASGSIVLIGADGSAALFTSQADLTALTGRATAVLGPLDQILAGALESQVLSADDVSGLLLRLETDGTPVIHATEAQIIAVTGAATARIRLPRFLVANQTVAQDLVSGALLLFSNLGVPIQFVGPVELAARLEVAPAAVEIVEWEQGGGTRSLFGRAAASTHVIRVEVNGTTARHVDGDDLKVLFPTVQNLTLIDIVADTLSDTLLIVVGNGARGVGIARVLTTIPPDVEVYTSSEDFTAELGQAFDISDAGVLTNGVPFAIDKGGANVMTFNAEGLPLVFAPTEDLAEAAGTASPSVALGVRIGDEAVVVPEASTGNLLLTR
jgi:hypothetical protein